MAYVYIAWYSTQSKNLILNHFKRVPYYTDKIFLIESQHIESILNMCIGDG